MLAPDQKIDWKTPATTSAIVVLAFAGLFYVANVVTTKELPGLYWKNAPGATITIVERSTNLPPVWHQIAIVTNGEYLPVDMPLPQAFYRVAHPNAPWHRWNDVDRYVTTP
jgi:hypothetical protein